MRVSIPGVPGVYYDTDSGTTAIGVAMTAVGRRAPKPKGYAIQLLPYLWSFDVDLREVPNDHPIQYLHPEGAQSLGELSPERGVREVGTELESVLRFVWSVNQEVESATNQLIGRSPEPNGVVIEIEDGSVNVGGDELETDAFDIDEASAAEPEPELESGTTVEIDGETDDESETETDGESGIETDSESGTETDGESDVFGATEEPPADDFETDEEFGSADEGTDDIDPDEP